jgi:hypothetical protein
MRRCLKPLFILPFVFSLMLLSLRVAAQEPREPVEAQGPDASAQNPQEKPADKKESSNAPLAPAEKRRSRTSQAAEAARRMARQDLVRLRDWESGWLTGVYVEKEQPLIPLTHEARWRIYLRQTLTTPGAYTKRMFAAGIDQARGVPSQWDDDLGGYAQRFASREGQFITSNSLAALGNAKLHYEPRYDQCRCSGFWPRTRHALMRNFATYNRTERELRPQWALYGGAFGGGLVSTAWKPHPRNAFAEGGRAMLGQAGYGALLNFFTEFTRDINRKLGAKMKK